MYCWKHRSAAIMVVILLTGVTLVAFSYPHYRQAHNERVLEEALTTLNDAAARFALEHGRAPENVSDLLLHGYLKDVPVDPFTARNDTWRLVENSADGRLRVAVHSGSELVSSRGSPYSTW